MPHPHRGCWLIHILVPVYDGIAPSAWRQLLTGAFRRLPSRNPPVWAEVGAGRLHGCLSSVESTRVHRGWCFRSTPYDQHAEIYPCGQRLVFSVGRSCTRRPVMVRTTRLAEDVPCTVVCACAMGFCFRFRSPSDPIGPSTTRTAGTTPTTCGLVVWHRSCFTLFDRLSSSNEPS